MSNREQQLAEAQTERDAARKAFDAAKPGSRKWLDAEENLSFWQGRVAFLDAAK